MVHKQLKLILNIYIINIFQINWTQYIMSSSGQRVFLFVFSTTLRVWTVRNALRVSSDPLQNLLSRPLDAYVSQHVFMTLDLWKYIEINLFSFIDFYLDDHVIFSWLFLHETDFIVVLFLFFSVTMDALWVKSRDVQSHISLQVWRALDHRLWDGVWTVYLQSAVCWREVWPLCRRILFLPSVHPWVCFHFNWYWYSPTVTGQWRNMWKKSLFVFFTDAASHHSCGRCKVDKHVQS